MLTTSADSELLYSTLAADREFAELIEAFVSEMPRRCAALRSQFAAASWPELKRNAHQLKGAAGGYGFDQLTPFAAQLEQAIETGADSATIEHALEALLRQCGLVRAGGGTQG